MALNYDELAELDDGSCEYPDNGNYSLNFDGSDDYVEVESFELGTTFSFETEIFLPEADYTSRNNTIFSYGPANDGWKAFAFGIASGGSTYSNLSLQMNQL